MATLLPKVLTSLQVHKKALAGLGLQQALLRRRLLVKLTALEVQALPKPAHLTQALQVWWQVLLPAQ